MSQLLLNTNAVVSFLCLLMSLHLFCQSSQFQVSVRLLGACFLTMGLQALFLSIKVSNHLTEISAALQPSMAILFGPLSYLIFRSALFDNIKLKIFDVLHLIPTMAVFTLMLNQQAKQYVDFVVLLSLLVYTLALTHIVWKKQKQLPSLTKVSIKHIENVQDWIYIWLLVFTVYSWLILASDFLIFLELGGGKILVQSFALVITVLVKLLIISSAFFYALQKSPMFDWLYVELNTHSEKALDDGKKRMFEEIINSFEQLVEDSSVYTQQMLSLKTMADKLCVPVRTFSNAINHQYGESYAKRMNRLRIRFAEKLLLEQPEQSIVIIMYESGFQTKSSFNKEFKAINGVSPSEFRQSRAAYC